MEINRKLIPIIFASILWLNLRFVDWLELSKTKKFPYNIEHRACLLRYKALKLHHCGLWAASSLLLLSSDVEGSIVLPWGIVHFSWISLVDWCHNLMHLKLYWANVLLSIQVVWVISIIHVIGFYQELLIFFEMVVYFKLGHEMWIQVVINAFCSTKFHPYVFGSLLFYLIQYQKSICFRKSIQIWQICKSKW